MVLVIGTSALAMLGGALERQPDPGRRQHRARRAPVEPQMQAAGGIQGIGRAIVERALSEAIEAMAAG